MTDTDPSPTSALRDARRAEPPWTPGQKVTLRFLVGVSSSKTRGIGGHKCEQLPYDRGFGAGTIRTMITGPVEHWYVYTLPVDDEGPRLLHLPADVVTRVP